MILSIYHQCCPDLGMLLASIAHDVSTPSTLPAHFPFSNTRVSLAGARVRRKLEKISYSLAFEPETFFVVVVSFLSVFFLSFLFQPKQTLGYLLCFRLRSLPIRSTPVRPYL